MTHDCATADRYALTAIAEALLAESEKGSGESRNGRLRLVQNINTKLHRLGAPAVLAAGVGVQQNAYDLIAHQTDNEDLCAHTRNFLQMALSRLERFDSSWLASLPPATSLQVIAGASAALLPSE